MSGFWDQLDDIGDLLDSASKALDTANHGVKKTQETKGNIQKIIERDKSGENQRDLMRIREYEERQTIRIRRTVIFCILMILLTILICIFL